MQLFDRPPSESGSVRLGTGLVWRMAKPQPRVAGSLAAGQLASILSEMPAVEVFDVTPGAGKEMADYPFTTSFYESSAYSSYRKVHFPDLMLPCSMADAVGAPTAVQRSFLLWDPRFCAL